MSKTVKYLLVVCLVAIVISSCKAEKTSQPQLSSLLYSGTDSHSRWVIVELDPWAQTSRLWIEPQRNACCPSRSPDGNHVAFFTREELETCSLWIADFDGQNAVQISEPYSCPSSSVSIEWSYEGQYIAFSTGSNIDVMKTYVLDTRTEKKIITVSGRDFAWSKSSDQLVVYGTREHSISGLEVIDIPSGARHWLLDVYLPSLKSLDWLPKASAVIFSTYIDQETANPCGVFAIDVDSKNPRELTQDTAEFVRRDIGGLRVSPDGESLLFLSNFHTRGGISDSGMMMLDIESGSTHHLARGVIGPTVWSPDSKSIVFGSIEDAQGNKMETWELFLVSLDDYGIRQLTYNGAGPIDVTW